MFSHGKCNWTKHPHGKAETKEPTMPCVPEAHSHYRELLQILWSLFVFPQEKKNRTKVENFETFHFLSQDPQNLG